MNLGPLCGVNQDFVDQVPTSEFPAVFLAHARTRRAPGVGWEIQSRCEKGGEPERRGCWE